MRLYRSPPLNISPYPLWVELIFMFFRTGAQFLNSMKVYFHLNIHLTFFPLLPFNFTVFKLVLLKLERALRALAKISGGAVCPGATRGQPQGLTPVFFIIQL